MLIGVLFLLYWRKWGLDPIELNWCISITCFLVLVNGSPLGFFQSSKGLRQRDRLSPYLFILAVETLSRILLMAKEGGFTDGFLVKGRNGLGVEVSHLLFADDTLILCDASKKNLEYLNWIFMLFVALSELKINMEESELIPVRDVSNLKELAGILGCKVGAFPTTYLGLRLEAPYKSYRV